MKQIISLFIFGLISTVSFAEGSAAGFASYLDVIHMADSNNDGMVSPKEVMYFDSSQAVGFQPFMVDHYAAFDTDGDGMVSMEEIKAGMEKQKMTDKDMLKMFFERQGFQPPR